MKKLQSPYSVETMQLLVLGLVLTCLKLSEARFLGLRGPIFRGLEDEEPVGGNSRTSEQQNKGVLQRETWPEIDPLRWKFPEDPVELESKPPVTSEQEQQAEKERVAIRCGESKIQVEVSQDLLGVKGQRVRPEEVTLGGCSATEADDLSHVLVFESELHGCGSKLVMTHDAFIYAFMLVYKPRESGRGGIIRSQSTVIGVECHYPR